MAATAPALTPSGRAFNDPREIRRRREEEKRKAAEAAAAESQGDAPEPATISPAEAPEAETVALDRDSADNNSTTSADTAPDQQPAETQQGQVTQPEQSSLPIEQATDAGEPTPGENKKPE